MHTTATLHVHPAAANPDRIFEVRRLALELGCRFIPAPLKSRTFTPSPINPNDGGRAA